MRLIDADNLKNLLWIVICGMKMLTCGLLLI